MRCKCHQLPRPVHHCHYVHHRSIYHCLPRYRDSVSIFDCCSPEGNHHHSRFDIFHFQLDRDFEQFDLLLSYRDSFCYFGSYFSYCGSYHFELDCFDSRFYLFFCSCDSRFVAEVDLFYSQFASPHLS